MTIEVVDEIVLRLTRREAGVIVRALRSQQESAIVSREISPYLREAMHPTERAEAGKMADDLGAELAK